LTGDRLSPDSAILLKMSRTCRRPHTAYVDLDQPRYFGPGQSVYNSTDPSLPSALDSALTGGLTVMPILVCGPIDTCSALSAGRSRPAPKTIS
jgi:hypothetical protein